MGKDANGNYELIHLVAVDYFSGAQLINFLVKPTSQLSAYNTEWSGVTPQSMSIAVQTGDALNGWPKARSYLWNFMDRNTILVGHGLSNDLKVLHMLHTNIVDSEIAIHRRFGRKHSVKNLCKEILGISVQEGDGVFGHSPVEDALASRELVIWATRNQAINKPTTTDKEYLADLAARKRAENARKTDEIARKQAEGSHKQAELLDDLADDEDGMGELLEKFVDYHGYPTDYGYQQQGNGKYFGFQNQEPQVQYMQYQGIQQPYMWQNQYGTRNFYDPVFAQPQFNGPIGYGTVPEVQSYAAAPEQYRNNDEIAESIVGRNNQESWHPTTSGTFAISTPELHKEEINASNCRAEQFKRGNARSARNNRFQSGDVPFSRNQAGNNLHLHLTNNFKDSAPKHLDPASPTYLDHFPQLAKKDIDSDTAGVLTKMISVANSHSVRVALPKYGRGSRSSRSISSSSEESVGRISESTEEEAKEGILVDVTDVNEGVLVDLTEGEVKDDVQNDVVKPNVLDELKHGVKERTLTESDIEKDSIKQIVAEILRQKAVKSNRLKEKSLKQNDIAENGTNEDNEQNRVNKEMSNESTDEVKSENNTPSDSWASDDDDSFETALDSSPEVAQPQTPPHIYQDSQPRYNSWGSKVDDDAEEADGYQMIYNN